MSKKMRKKSSKPTTGGKAIRAKSARSAKTATSKTRSATAAKTSKTKAKQTGNATAKASHRAPSKKLKSSSAGKSAPRTIKVSKTATTPAAGNPVLSKPPGEKPAESAVPRSALASPLAEGAKAPAFSLPRDGGSTVSLDDYAGRKLVLFFYPRADTPGCTKEAIDFTRLTSAFADAQTAVLGVSADPLKAQESFRNKHQLSTPLVSDEQHEMLEAYGAWGEKSMYGRTFHGVLRTTVLVGGNGRIVRIWRNVKVDGHADEVLAAAQAPD
jgi:thioredoxin-dependent peroxiredoxin